MTIKLEVIISFELNILFIYETKKVTINSIAIGRSD